MVSRPLTSAVENVKQVSREPTRAPVNGNANKILPEDEVVHSWYRFVLSFPPHLVRRYIGKFSFDENSVVLDPFCGTGTTLVECRKLNIQSVGLEAHPLIHFAARIKVDWTPDPSLLLQHARRVADRATKVLNARGIYSSSSKRGFQKLQILQGLESLSPEAEKLLLTGSISPVPLSKTLVLLSCLKEEYDERFHGHETLALGSALVAEIGNLTFGPEVGVSAPKVDAPVIESWLGRVERIAKDLEDVSSLKSARSSALRGDSRVTSTMLAAKSVDGVITSPPYPNEKDYTRTTRLESVILGFIQTKVDLQSVKRGMVRSNSRGVFKADDDDKWVSDNEEVRRIAEDIEKRRVELGKTSGFERMYPRVTRLYFGGMVRHLSDLRTVLRPGASLAYVVGDQASYLRIMIRTGKLIAQIAESLGYQVLGTDLFRTRLATATREQLREEVVLLRWPG